MKSYRVLAALLALTSLSSVAEGANRPDPLKSANNEFWLAAGGTFLNYKEPLTPPNLPDSERDWLPSIAGGASLMMNKGFYLAADADLYFGDATYRGAYLATPTVPLTSTTQETTYSVNGRVGWGFHMGQSLMFTPYVEMGMRNWRRELSAAQVETYNHFDALAGAMFQYAPTDTLVFTVYGGAGTTLNANMRYGGYTYKLGETLLWRAGTKIAYNISPRYEIFSTFSYQHFRYGQSPVQPNFTYEPSSFTNEATARIGFGYKFN